MNKTYIIDFNVPNHYGIRVEIKAENSELALNQAQGMLHGEWTNLIDINGDSIRVKTDAVLALSVVEIID